MLRLVLLAVITSALMLIGAYPARAGTPITKLPSCVDESMRYTGATDARRYRDAVLCLINRIRVTQHLNTLKRSAALERAGQGWATALGKSGRTDHGKSVAEIPRRIAKAGYTADALNEALGVGAPADTPYAIVANMMEDFACTEILDPRFRDAGVGVNLGKLALVPGAKGVHVVVELGRKRGAKALSSSTKPSRTCSHRLPPAPTSPVRPAAVLPLVHDADVTVTLQCVASTTCVFEATLKLAHQGAVSRLGQTEIAGGARSDVVFALDPAALSAEKASARPGIELTLTSSDPYRFSDLFSVGI